RRAANGRPKRRNGASKGISASGNSASCRARVRQIRTNRTKLRALRRSPNRGGGGSETPGGMERSDAPRQVAELDVVEPSPSDHLGELALPREATNALDEIGVSVAIAGDDLSQ